MLHLSRRAVIVLLVGASLLSAQTGAGPAPASAPSLGAPKPFPYAFVFPRPSADELKARRAALAKEIKDGAVVVVSSEKPSLSSHRYSPDHDVYYLTGIDTDFCAMTLIAKDGKVADVKLFLPKEDPMYTLWNGSRVTAGDAAKEASGIADIGVVKDDNLQSFEEALTKIAESGKPVFMSSDASERRSRQPKKLSLDTEGRNAKVRDFLKGRRIPTSRSAA